MNLEELDHYGIDFQKGLERCMNDEEFYKEYLRLFLEDNCYFCAKEAFEKQDYEMMFRSLHELKGVCANVEMYELYDAVSALVEVLRRQVQMERIPECFAKVTTAYDRVREGIRLI